MSKVFIIADLHLGHEKIALARGFNTTNQHNNAVIDNWNSVVGKRDSVFVLGDVAFGAHNLELLAYMTGTKKLVMGNHDKYPITEYIKYFSQVYGCVRYKGIFSAIYQCMRTNLIGLKGIYTGICIIK